MNAAPEPPEDDGDLLTRVEASAYLERFHVQLRPSTLARLWSVGGNGPPGVLVRNRPRYPRGTLRAWALSQRSDPQRSRRDAVSAGR